MSFLSRPPSPQPESHVLITPKNFSSEMMLSHQNRDAWNKGAGERRGSLACIPLGRPRFGCSSPWTTSLGLKEPDKSVTPKGLSLRKVGSWWAGHQLVQKPLSPT